jgi:hypothetical protein
MGLSAIEVGPWNGVLPEPHEKAELFLTNGDSVGGAIKGVREGIWAIESEIGSLDFPLEQVEEVGFGGVPKLEKAAARLRFTDGSIIHVESFRLDAKGLTAHSAVLGDIQVPMDALSELIPNPPPLRFPHPLAEWGSAKGEKHETAEPGGGAK